MKTIFVDADVCKKNIREYLVNFVLRESKQCIQLVIVSNKTIPNILHSERLYYIQVSQTPEAADNYIISYAKKEDLVLTRDILLAQKLVEKGITVINELAEIYHKDTIIARKKRALQNAEQRTFMRTDTKKHLKYTKLQKEKKELAKFSQYLNKWKQSAQSISS